MVFPRSGHPYMVDVYRYVIDGYDDDDVPTYSPDAVIRNRQGRFKARRTRSDRLVADGVNIAGTLVIPYRSGDEVTEDDEVVLRSRTVKDEQIRFKVFTVNRQDLYRKPAFWEIEVVRHA